MDPYRILGVSPNATQEQIHAAYRKLVKQYHPDRFPDGPQKEMATEKLKQINEAYDTICGKGGSASASGSGQRQSSVADLARVRSLLQVNNLAAAAQILDAMPVRNAEWHYLYGVIYLRRGWYDNARKSFQAAVNMDPGNAEYYRAYSSINQAGRPYSYRDANAPQSGAAGCSGCNMCTSLFCADCCCECMGGDLIRCC
jgi:molecular chaperone DnaJ